MKPFLLPLALTAITLTGCAAMHQQKMSQLWQQTSIIEQGCESSYEAGDIKTHMDKTACTVTQAFPLFEKEAGESLPYVRRIFAMKALLAEKLDKKQITPAEAQMTYAEFRGAVEAEEAAIRAERQAAINASMNALGQQMIQQGAPSPSSSVNCRSVSHGNRTNTTCQ
ncbi:MAG: hypothetical protein P8P30_10065 [Rickettsiales bacterium]|nr:hypothetical protein [Rickettsiales bacterium]